MATIKRKTLMGKKLSFTLTLVFILFASSSALWADISITGTVQQPLILSLRDLENHQSLTVRFSEITAEGHSSRGEVYYRGVPLKALLEMACIDKEAGADFSKPIDLAILVKNKAGIQVVLSWGEVMDRNPSEVILALSATKNAPNAKAETGSEGLEHQTGFPKLVIASDMYADRSLNDVRSIEVLNVTSKLSFTKAKTLSAPETVFTGAIKNPFTLKDLSGFHRVETEVRQWGGGKENQSLKKFSGVPLRTLLDKAGIAHDTNTVFLISAADGYRCLFSYGEVYMNLLGERIIIADTLDNRPLDKGGKFEFVAPDEPSSGRWIKSVSKIEVMKLKPAPAFYIISAGCGDASLITLDAVSYMAKADAVICSDDLKKRFSRFIGDKPVLFDVMPYIEKVFKKNNPKLPSEERSKLLKEKKDKAGAMVRELLNKGQSIAFLEYGDPTLFTTGIWWIRKYLKDEEIKIVPGVSSFNGANAAIAKDTTCKGAVILSAPWALKSNEGLIKSAAEQGATLALFMGLEDLPNLMPLFQKYYADTAPVAVVYYAGYAEKEKVIRTTLKEVPKIVAKEPEKFMGVLYIGGCLENDVKGYHFN